ncbi:ETX/MTX2 family pore-forming toxin [Streptomyces sp. NPDC127051]|uniref:ETX/MTX2 family pore-forming toxin n=1 Tax=Streptomyces sp. NPDC127051 TaxID=3347119 RepID=UPI0036528D53
MTATRRRAGADWRKRWRLNIAATLLLSLLVPLIGIPAQDIATAETGNNNSPALANAFLKEEQSFLKFLRGTARNKKNVALLGYPSGVDDKSDIESDHKWPKKDEVIKDPGDPANQNEITIKADSSELRRGEFDMNKVREKADAKAVELSNSEERDVAGAAKKFHNLAKECLGQCKENTSVLPSTSHQNSLVGLDGDMQKACTSGIAACMFLGDVDEQYPVMNESPLVKGPITHTITWSESHSHSTKVSEGWTFGGKVVGKLKTPAWELNAEFGASYSTTTTTEQKAGEKDNESVRHEFGPGKAGFVQSRFKGAYYVGFIVARYSYRTYQGKAVETTLLPARILVKSEQVTETDRLFSFRDLEVNFDSLSNFPGTLHGPCASTRGVRRDDIFNSARRRVFQQLENFAPMPDKEAVVGYPVPPVASKQYVHIEKTLLPTSKVSGSGTPTCETLAEQYGFKASLKDAKEKARAALYDNKATVEERKIAQLFVGTCEPGAEVSHTACLYKPGFNVTSKVYSTAATTSEYDAVNIKTLGFYPSGTPGTVPFSDLCANSNFPKKVSSCMFVGHMEERYPELAQVGPWSNSDNADKPLIQSFSHTKSDSQSRSQQTGYTLGGKITGKLMKVLSDEPKMEGDVGLEFNMSYTKTWTDESHTSREWTETDELAVPPGKSGAMATFANGAYYVGYVICHIVTTDENDVTGQIVNTDNYLHLPARIFVKANSAWARNTVSLWPLVSDNPQR